MHVPLKMLDISFGRPGRRKTCQTPNIITGRDKMLKSTMNLKKVENRDYLSHQVTHYYIV